MENAKKITKKIGTISVPKKIAKAITVLLLMYSLCLPAQFATDYMVSVFCLYYALTGKNEKAKIVCLGVFLLALLAVSRIAKIFAIGFAVVIVATAIVRHKKES